MPAPDGTVGGVDHDGPGRPAWEIIVGEMSIELLCLVINALWGFALVGIEIVGKTQAAGSKWNSGNRDTEREFPEWIDRAGRALANHKENFPLFLTAVLAVTLTNQADTLSAVGAVVYVLARVTHGLVYVAGITGVRSAAFVVGLLATLAIYVSLLV